MSALGDITFRQNELRDRLACFRTKVREVKVGPGSSCGPSEESKENRSDNYRNFGNRPVDSMTKMLQSQLDSVIEGEKRDQQAREEEKEELQRLRSEVKNRSEERQRAVAAASATEGLKTSLTKQTARLELAMQRVNELTFERSVMQQQVEEWREKMSTHVSNVKEMAVVRQREKDLLYRARKDREREVKTLKEAHEQEKKRMNLAHRANEERGEEAVASMAAQMQQLQLMALDKIQRLEKELACSATAAATAAAAPSHK